MREILFRGKVISRASGAYESLDNGFTEFFEVIGNIYDNPELLKGGD